MTTAATIGTLLREHRTTEGLTRPELALALSEALGEHLDPENLKRWENGQRIPETRYHQAVADVLGCPLDRITRAVAAARQQRYAKLADPGGGHPESGSTVKRREFLSAAAGTVGAGLLPDLRTTHDGIDAALTGSHRADIDYLTQVFERHIGGYHGRDPGRVLDQIHQDLALLREVLARPLRTSERTELARTTAGITGLVGIIEHDLGRQREAGGWFATAAQAAAESGDTRLHAWVLGRHAMVGLNYGAPHAAAALAARAQSAAGTKPSAAAALAAAVHARALAQIGDHQGAHAAVARAQHTAEHLDAEELADTWLGYPLQKHAVHLSQAYTLLGDTGAAYREQAAALALTTSPSVMVRALIALDSAACHAADLDHQAAADLGARTWEQLPPGHRSGLVRARAELLRDRLTGAHRDLLAEALAS